MALVVCALTVADPAHANRKYASIVVEEQSGEVLYARNSRSYRYPASLTKVMTLYMLFDELASGKRSLDDKLKASRRAAGQPPSKLGIKAGQTIRIRDAIKSLVVRSANDVAVVIAENLAGSEWKFARRMTRQARRLGMSRTTFRNASGLPNRRQKTTAHDLSVLARAIRRDFPQYLHFFEETKFTWGGRTWTTHNHVLKRYKGADGMKTGYTRASGFNLMTSVEQDGVRLVGIVLGGRTPKRRDRDMERILNLTYGRIEKNPEKYQRRFFAALPKPVKAPGRVPGAPAAAPVTVASAAPLQRLDVAAVAKALDKVSPAAPVGSVPKPIKAERVTLASVGLPVSRPASLQPEAEKPVLPEPATVKTASLLPVPELREAPSDEAEKTAADLPEKDKTDEIADRILAALRTGKDGDATRVAIEEAEKMRRLASTDRAVAALAAADTSGPDRRLALALLTAEQGDGNPDLPADLDLENTDVNRGVQVGAFLRLSTATRFINDAMRHAPEVLTSANAAIVPSETPSGTIYRARFGPFAEVDANTACGLLEARGMDCFPIQESNWAGAIRP